jgi:flagellar basal-body rod protein FlgB
MSLFSSIEQIRAGLDYHLARQNLLTMNLAHVDTPGFHPVDLERHDSFTSVLSVSLAATDPKHIGTSERQGHDFRVVTDKGAAPGLDGNAVSVDREAAKMAANNIRYETLATLAGGGLSDLLWAAKDGQ